MKIVVSLKAVAQCSTLDIELSEIGLTKSEWLKLKQEERNKIIQEHVDAEGEINSPYLQYTSYILQENRKK